jgi:hypothetical protein
MHKILYFRFRDAQIEEEIREHKWKEQKKKNDMLMRRRREELESRRTRNYLRAQQRESQRKAQTLIISVQKDIMLKSRLKLRQKLAVEANRKYVSR